MKNLLKAITAAMLGAGLFLLPNLAQAQQVSLRVEPGVAIPLTAPQDQRFKVGGDVEVKPELGIGSYFSLGPSLGVLSFHSDVNNVDAPTAWLFGGFMRVKRPHDEKNTGSGLTAVSPWADADLQYVRSGELDRLGWAAAIGASVPTDSKRWLWVGPFARYQVVFEEDGKADINTNSAKTLILGLSFELEPDVKKTEPKKEVQPTPCKPIVQLMPAPIPSPAVIREEHLELDQTIQFQWDSAALDATASQQLDDVVAQIKAAESFDAIKIEGHASSEGQAKHNDGLSQKRADAVLEYLVARGISRDKLTAVSFGSNVPTATNKNEAGRAKNRRVFFKVKFVIVKEVK